MRRNGHRNGTYHLAVREFKAGLVQGAVDRHRGNVARAARFLGISRSQVYKYLKFLRRYPVKPPTVRAH